MELVTQSEPNQNTVVATHDRNMAQVATHLGLEVTDPAES